MNLDTAAKFQISKKNEYRIFILGGSTVQDGEPSFSEIIQKKIDSETDLDMKVFNWGTVSSNSGMELSRLIYEVADYQPDLVIFYNGGNNLLDPLSWDPRPGYPFNFLVYESNPMLTRNSNPLTFFKLLFLKSNLVKHFFYQPLTESIIPLQQLRSDVQWKSSQWEQAVADTYLSHMQKAQLISNASSAQFLGIFQPLAYNKTSRSISEESFIVPNQQPAIINIQDKIRAKIAQDPTRQIVDFTQVFNNHSETIYIDPIHLNHEGNTIIAENIYLHIQRIIEATSSSQTN